MFKVASLGIGLAVGAAIGAVLVVWYAPATGKRFINNVREGYEETMAEARAAQVKRRAELEAQLGYKLPSTAGTVS